MSIKRLSGCQLSEGVSGQGLAERTGRPAPEGPPAPSNAAAARPATVAGGGGTCLACYQQAYRQEQPSSRLFTRTLVHWAASFDPKHNSLNRNKNSDVNPGSKVSFVSGIYVFS